MITLKIKDLIKEYILQPMKCAKLIKLVTLDKNRMNQSYGFFLYVLR